MQFAFTLIVFVVFLGFLALFHVPLIWRWGRSRRFWNAAEYVWLGIAGLGLYAAAGEAFRSMNASQYDFLKMRRDVSLETARSGARNGVSLFTRYFEYDKFKDESLKGEYKMAGDWFSQTDVALQEPLNTVSLARYYDVNSRRWEESRLVKELKDQTMHDIARFLDDNRALQHVAPDHGRSETERDLLMLYPWLLGIALSLRIAKTTFQTFFAS